MKSVTSLITVLAIGISTSMAADESKPQSTGSHPLTQKERQQLTDRFTSVLKELSKETASVGVHSRRGDALFFLKRYKQAVTEYESMVMLDPDIDASHWRLGIAYFFADQPEKGAAQFEKYHSFDDVDRENGIWRYLSQYKAGGAEKAKQELIRYEKDDREPFPAVYRLFDGTIQPKQALDAISADLPATERDKRLFYTELYIGMHMVVQKKPNAAREHLARAVSCEWPRRSGFGPNYMWHVARVQLDDLLSNNAQGEPSDDAR